MPCPIQSLLPRSLCESTNSIESLAPWWLSSVSAELPPRESRFCARPARARARQRLAEDGLAGLLAFPAIHGQQTFSSRGAAPLQEGALQGRASGEAGAEALAKVADVDRRFPRRWTAGLPRDKRPSYQTGGGRATSPEIRRADNAKAQEVARSLAVRARAVGRSLRGAGCCR
jgi:hypothetical protein